MIVKLKTLEQLEEELKPYADRWLNRNGNLIIDYNERSWYINKKMIECFGKYIDVVYNVDMYKDYTHCDKKLHCVWHEMWFEPELEDFISEEEFML
jgi:hypothetical protein